MKLNTHVDIAKSDNGKQIKVVMEPLDKGYGVTLGNAMRRVLLNSLTGAAVTAVRIQGVEHEFGSIPGIQEDILDILINIKQLVVRSYSTTPKLVKLEVTKVGNVVAGDIQTDAEVEIINKDHKICTITTKNTNLKIEFRIEQGVGYRLAELNHFENMPIGTIPIDSSFSPVIKVNHTIVDTRVGNRTDLDKLTMEIWTNGSLSAENAIEESSKILIDSFSLFTDYKHVVPVVKSELEAADTGTVTDPDLTIEDLELSARSSNCLKKAGILKVTDLVEKPMKELMKIKNFGKKSSDEINEKLAQYGLKLKDS